MVMREVFNLLRCYCGSTCSLNCLEEWLTDLLKISILVQGVLEFRMKSFLVIPSINSGLAEGLLAGC
jgi:hypothetical protein